MTVAMPGSDSSMDEDPGISRRTPLVAGGPDRAGLAIWTDQSHNRCVLRLTGRLCADTVRLLDNHVDLLGCRACDEVVMDLSGLEAMDPVGARLIVGFGHYVAARGGRFRLDGAAPGIRAMVDRAEIEICSS
ncbi:MAG TPA: STAS domain-containing protein [Acidimicrobiales bacterium]|nr:STAS domain-containing protein [Acidimicrobiales bacterium]